MQSSPLDIRNIRKNFGAFAALDGISLDVQPGELLTLLGPSGSGKTTLLRVIAGFEQPDSGSILLEDTDITDRPAAARNVGMVFQNYALFPHMNVYQNIAFPLEMRSMSKASIQDRVASVLQLVDLTSFESRLPHLLSGGQQQRVALARALVYEPSLLLLDEPFGALDRKLREGLQLEVRHLQQRLGITTLFITHDQEEALILSDRIGVMNCGRLEQVGTPTEIYDRPASAFVADFVGESSIFNGRVRRMQDGINEVQLDNGLRLVVAGQWPDNEAVGVMFRPERLRPSDGSEPNILAGLIVERIFLGNAWRYKMVSREGIEFSVRLPGETGADTLRPGDHFSVWVPPEGIHLF